MWVCKSCRNATYLSAKSTRREYALAGPFRKASQKLPNYPARTRFAPSPTGYMHLGSLRTALFNYLLAKATGGQFLLRIEDTDQKRTVPGAEERICRDLEWAGLQWDEGPGVGGVHGPYRQSERTELYRKHAEDLIDSGHAYRCFCTAERLNELATARSKLGLPTDYDRTCAGIAREESRERADKGHAYIIRLKVPETYPRYEDLVYGRVGGSKGKPKIILGEQSFEDPVLIKSDGQPTYHLANVVDDHYMKITHVVRAVEWMPSTPKHLAMYQAFGWQPPAFAHVGLLQDKSHQKLSKRNLDVDIDSFRSNGVFPEALVNHVALLGWSHNEASDFLSLERLTNIFDLRFTKGNTIVNFHKLAHLQKLYGQKFIQQGGSRFEILIDGLMSVIKERQHPDTRFGFPSEAQERDYVGAVLRADAKQYTSAADFYERCQNFFRQSRTLNAVNLPEDLTDLDCQRIFRYFEQISDLNWTDENIQLAQRNLTIHMAAIRRNSGVDVVPDAADASHITHDAHALEKSGALISRYLRWAIMNLQPGPPMALSMELLGRQETLLRLQTACSHAWQEGSGPLPVEQVATSVNA